MEPSKRKLFASGAVSAHEQQYREQLKSQFGGRVGGSGGPTLGFHTPYALPNGGLNCYAVSIMSLLFYATPLLEQLEATTSSLSPAGEALLLLLQSMRGPRSAAMQQQLLADVFHSMRLISAPDFTLNRQEDASEFLVAIIERCLPVDIIDDLFRIEFARSVLCAQGTTREMAPDTKFLTMLHPHVGDGNVVSDMRALLHAHAYDEIPDFACPCNACLLRRAPATAVVAFDARVQPKMVVLQLVRFDNNMDKLEFAVEVPATLDLSTFSEYCARQHIGKSGVWRTFEKCIAINAQFTISNKYVHRCG